MLSNSARKLPRAEALVALALDDLEEERARLGIVVEAGRLLQEDLQQVLPCAARRRPGSRARAARRCPRRCCRCRCARAARAACRSSCPGVGMNSTPRARSPRTAVTMSVTASADVLHAVAAVVLGEDVDLRLLEERAERLVVGELHARGRIPHHHRLAGPSRARALLPRATSLVWNCDLPELLEAEHVLHPQQRRLHGLEVRRDVIDPLEAEAVLPAARRRRARRSPGTGRW